MDKLAGSKAVIYNRGNTPYFFCLEPKQQPILPTMYSLYHLTGESRPGDTTNKSLLSLRIFLKEGVQSFIFKGADLMWPGIRHIESSKGFTDFDQGQMVIIYALERYEKDGEE